MNEIIIRPGTLSDRAFIRSVSVRTWPSTYGHFIAKDQIDFMLEWMYSDDSLEDQFQKGHQFFIAGIQKVDGLIQEIGFCSLSAEQADSIMNPALNSYKLNKLYVLPIAHGTGSGKALLQKAIDVAKAEGASSLFLQVNKENKAYHFYIKNGFVKESESIFEIGNGFLMDDYIMRLTF